jgi:hypothetical protein
MVKGKKKNMMPKLWNNFLTSLKRVLLFLQTFLILCPCYMSESKTF